ncbi:MAG: hypothetical protein LBB25_01715 [Holosporaceae bacterium]|nr:hypothetical protein [Holosporaceae bacterium]
MILAFMVILFLALVGLLATAAIASIVVLWGILFILASLLLCSMFSLIFFTDFELILAIVLLLIVIGLLFRRRIFSHNNENNIEK